MQLEELRREWELHIRASARRRSDRQSAADGGQAEAEKGRWLARMLELARSPLKKEAALHLGCGTGEWTQGLAPFFNEVVGAEIAPSLLESARGVNAYPERVQYHLLDGEAWLRCFSHDRYDFICCGGLYSVMDPLSRVPYVREIVRMLAPGGVGVIETPSERDSLAENALVQAVVSAGARLLAVPDAAGERRCFTKDHPYTPSLSVVVPFYNEGDGVDRFFQEVTPVLESIGMDFEIVCVNDGSRDDTLSRLESRRKADRRVRVIALTRNFGKESALAAALDCSRGRVVVPMDADLQDPPEVISLLVEKWREGFPVVIARRRERKGESWLKRQSAGWFYRFYNRLAETPIPANTGDFRLLDRQVLNSLRSLPERSRFTKGLFAWLGYPTAEVSFDRSPRYAGTTKWNYWRLWNFALDGIVSFSTVPLRVWTYLGGVIATSSLLYALYLVMRTLFFYKTTPGYASLMVAMLFLGGVQLIGLGVLGEYLGRVFKESKGRPLYLIHKEID